MIRAIVVTAFLLRDQENSMNSHIKLPSGQFCKYIESESAI